jgi:hypothetical protein
MNTGDFFAMETQTLTAHVPLPMAEKIREMSMHLGIPPDRIVERALEFWLESEEERRIAELRKIATANAILVVEHHRVIDWADSL